MTVYKKEINKKSWCMKWGKTNDKWRTTNHVKIMLQDYWHRVSFPRAPGPDPARCVGAPFFSSGSSNPGTHTYAWRKKKNGQSNISCTFFCPSSLPGGECGLRGKTARNSHARPRRAQWWHFPRHCVRFYNRRGWRRRGQRGTTVQIHLKAQSAKVSALSEHPRSRARCNATRGVCTTASVESDYSIIKDRRDVLRNWQSY